MKIGVFLPNWIGDTAMSTPALRALRTHFGRGARIVGIMRPYVAEVLSGTHWLDKTIYFHRRSTNPAEHLWPVVNQLRREQFDVMLLLTNSFRTAAMAWASGAPMRVGYSRYFRGPLLTHRLFEPRVGVRRLPAPMIDTYLRLVYAMGCAPESPRLELGTLPRDESAADAVWKKHSLPPGNQVVVLNSSGAYGAAKLWPTELVVRLARRIVTEQDLAVLVICGPDERRAAAEIVRQVNHPRAVSLEEEPISIGLTKACIRRSRMLVTTDSGPRFFGVAFGVPVVALFGPTDPAWTRTHDAGEMCLAEEVPCSPCGRRTCPLGHHDCMRNLSVQRVYGAVLEQLARSAAAQAA